MSYLTSEYDPESCKNVLIRHYEMLEAVCPDEYLEWGYDSPEQCINDEMGMVDPRACM